MTEIDPNAAGTQADAFDPLEHPDRLNLGCGWDKRDGFLNVDFQDFHDPDLVADVRHLDVLPTGHYQEVVAQDVLEHLERTETLAALQEWARLLRPGGTIVLRVPDILGVATLLSECRSVAQQEELVQCLFGTQAYTGDYHHCGFTEILLRHYLAAAGFEAIEISHRDQWLFDVVGRRAAGPVAPEMGDLPFMDLGAGAEAPATDAATPPAHDAAAAALARAREHTDLGGTDPGPTRWRTPKRMLLRVLRITNHRQVAHNIAMEDAVEALLRDR